jgi:hypothetical protein
MLILAVKKPVTIQKLNRTEKKLIYDLKYQIGLRKKLKIKILTMFLNFFFRFCFLKIFLFLIVRKKRTSAKLHNFQ